MGVANRTCAHSGAELVVFKVSKLIEMAQGLEEPASLEILAVGMDRCFINVGPD